MKLFIGCSSKENIAKEYLKNGQELIKMIAKIKDVDLVFGAFHQGWAFLIKNFKGKGKK